MRSIKNILYGVIAIMKVSFFFISCEEEISINLATNDEVRIVVEGRMTNELKNQQVRLTYTQNYFTNTLPQPILNAEAYIEEIVTGNRFDLTLVNDTLGIYETDVVAGIPGNSYTLNIDVDGESYRAVAYLDSVAQLDSINYEYEYFAYFEQGFYKIRMSAYEPPPIGDIYMFNIYLNDTLINDKLVDTPYQEDLFFDDNYMVNVEVEWLEQEYIVMDTNAIRLEMLSISREEYEFNNAFVMETAANGSIFSGPPANIPTNIENISGGYNGVGFFAASSVSVRETTLIKVHEDSTNNPDFER
ncbi:MAG: DUF4249 domain-containing protein [Bacteroidales bacterium]|nr:DUF4249 domain-containing protein [Bacteroidales bacterium]